VGHDPTTKHLGLSLVGSSGSVVNEEEGAGWSLLGTSALEFRKFQAPEVDVDGRVWGRGSRMNLPLSWAGWSPTKTRTGPDPTGLYDLNLPLLWWAG
jgi:hypothetical protein